MPRNNYQRTLNSVKATFYQRWPSITENTASFSTSELNWHLGVKAIKRCEHN
ncbi:hypothetical protein PICMEDRAFT_114368 [Pichia membranifaciens NRRL Y-2026]|uniref:Uncharacterized protein n=1 Tax=Pichia membranifaciens NRRL Y-2026 TaxID=763406 RepID=A0A1E3NN21_9ASCO|nr:hypothetical protein PICMEDRAFT_114368 [Pichia membranifaciens NRRL Y-2026]ODQ47502.1 hypothetical protein PICMEDRAFT_114368 [Pichia membranifaciens NRRL Y-2026]